MIEGVSIRAKIGAYEVLRSPKIVIESKRRQIVGTASLEVPDPTGEIRNGLNLGDKVQIIMRYKGDNPLEQTWQGTIYSLQTEADNIIVIAKGLEQVLLDTFITEAFYEEPANIVAKRILEKTGYSIKTVDFGEFGLPYQVFSRCTVAGAIKQLSQTISQSYQVDLSKHALWLDNNRQWNFSNGNEDGDIFIIETAKNLLSHRPPQKQGEMGELETVLLPSLTHSRIIKIRDSVRDIVQEVRAQEVTHKMEQGKNRTIIRYGKDEGWG